MPKRRHERNQLGDHTLVRYNIGVMQEQITQLVELNNEGKLSSDQRRELEKLVLAAWWSADDTDARGLLDVIVAVPSAAWEDLIYAARHGKCPHHDLLKSRESEIYASVAEGWVDYRD